MSHFTVLVALPADEVKTEKRIEAAVDRALAPYQEDSEGGSWDWYEIGGRWSGMITDRSGEKRDFARKKDVDWGKSAEGYLTMTHAFVDLDGEWHEQGQMGWFGSSAQEFTDTERDAQNASLMNGVNDNDWLVLVDCHI